jgi:UDP-GlcNAc:undecaprenyl-phosphate GlcNAc-1-phosphate transferase
MLFVIYMRLARGVPVFVGSPDHLVLRLRRHGFPVPAVVCLMYGAAALLGGIGLALLFVDVRVALALVGLTGLGFIATTVVMKRVDVTVSGPAPAEAVRALPAEAQDGRVPS